MHGRGGVTPGRALDLRIMKGGPRTAFSDVAQGVTGLDRVAIMDRGNRDATTFVMNAARCTMPLNGLVSIRARVTGRRTRLGRLRNFLIDMRGGLSGRHFMTGTPATMMRVRHGGRSSTRDGVGTLGRDLTGLEQWGRGTLRRFVRSRILFLLRALFFRAGLGRLRRTRVSVRERERFFFVRLRYVCRPPGAAQGVGDVYEHV